MVQCPPPLIRRVWISCRDAIERSAEESGKEADYDHDHTTMITEGVIQEVDSGRLYGLYGVAALCLISQFAFHSYGIRLYVQHHQTAVPISGGISNGGGGCSQPLLLWIVVTGICGLIAATPILVVLCLLWNTISNVVTLPRSDVVRETIATVYCLYSFRACVKWTVYGVLAPLTAFNLIWVITGSIWVSRIGGDDLSVDSTCPTTVFYFMRYVCV